MKAEGHKRTLKTCLIPGIVEELASGCLSTSSPPIGPLQGKLVLESERPQRLLVAQLLMLLGDLVLLNIRNSKFRVHWMGRINLAD